MVSSARVRQGELADRRNMPGAAGLALGVVLALTTWSTS